MEEGKKYPPIENEPEMASEPTGMAMANPNVVKPSNHNIPIGVPKTVEEALADIEEGEREFECGETYTHKEVMQMVWDKIDGYAGKL